MTFLLRILVVPARPAIAAINSKPPAGKGTVEMGIGRPSTVLNDIVTLFTRPSTWFRGPPEMTGWPSISVTPSTFENMHLVAEQNSKPFWPWQTFLKMIDLPRAGMSHTCSANARGTCIHFTAWCRPNHHRRYLHRRDRYHHQMVCQGYVVFGALAVA